MTIQTLAKEAAGYFTRRNRIDGQGFWCTADDTPEWVVALCHKAHGDFLPDDWRYAFIYESLNAVADSEAPGDVRLDQDVYNHDLLSWVSSHLWRPGYCDAATDDYGTIPENLMQHIAWGQEQEKNEVLASVLASLEARLSEVEGE